MKPTFTNREQYLQWRAEWRARYKEISHDIRYLRLLIAAQQSGMSLPKWDGLRAKLLEIQKKFTHPQFGCRPHWELFLLRKEARQMLEWRKESKALAQQQYLAAHQACSSPA